MAYDIPPSLATDKLNCSENQPKQTFSQIMSYRVLGIERVYLPLCKVEDAPF